MKEPLQTLWSTDYRGRILLCNLANQISNGSLSPERIKEFATAARVRPETFVSRDLLLGSAFPDDRVSDSTQLHFQNSTRPRKVSHRLYARVEPFGPFLNKLAGNDDCTELLDEIFARGLEINEERRQQRLKPLRKRLARSFVGADELAREWNIPPELMGIEWYRGQLTEPFRGTDHESPIFFSILNRHSALAKLLETHSPETPAADALRDALGLDHMGPSYFHGTRLELQPTITTLFLFREEQLGDLTIRRPSPFDATSAARFRAAFGNVGGNCGSCGRTANLANLATPPIEGPPEVVIADGQLNPPDVLFTLLGDVLAPRGDVYQPLVPMPSEDLAFTLHCQGKWDHTDVIDTIVEAFS